MEENKEAKPKSKASKAAKENVENPEKVEKVKVAKKNKTKEDLKEGKAKPAKSKAKKEQDETKQKSSKVRIKDDDQKKGTEKEGKGKSNKASKSKVKVEKENDTNKERKKKPAKGKSKKKLNEDERNNNENSKRGSKSEGGRKTRGKSTDPESAAFSLEMNLGEEEETDDAVNGEWNSDAVRKMKLIENGFSYCLVLVMEDSTETTKYGEYLLKAVETGVRKNFVGISGSEISERVMRFMAEMDSEEEYQEDTYTLDQFQQLPNDQQVDSVTYDEDGIECDCDEDEEINPEPGLPPNSTRDNDETFNLSCPCTCDVEHDMTDVKPIGEYPLSCVDVDNAFQDIQYIVGDLSCDEADKVSKSNDDAQQQHQQLPSEELTWNEEIPGEGIDHTSPPPLTMSQSENDEIEELLSEDSYPPHSIMQSYYGEGNAEDEVMELEEDEEEEVYPSGQRITNEGNAEKEKVEVNHSFTFEDMDRTDLFAEAVKHTLGRIKKEDGSVKSLELTGVRSKDLIKTVNYTMMLPTQENNGEDESPPPPPPTPSPPGKSISSINHDGVSRVEDVRSTAIGGKGKGRNTLKVESEKSNVDQKENKDEDGNFVKKVPTTPKGSKKKDKNIGIKTRMRKRGEVLVPEYMRYKDDSPAKGPRKYVFLQGFYNPMIIYELRKIGVVVDAVLLISGGKSEKCQQNSSNGTSTSSKPANSAVFQFWKRLMEMYHTPPYNKRHITILHYSLPELNTVQLDTTESLLPYIFKVYDGVAAMVYEMIRQQQLCCCKY